MAERLMNVLLSNTLENVGMGLKWWILRSRIKRGCASLLCGCAGNPAMLMMRENTAMGNKLQMLMMRENTAMGNKLQMRGKLSQRWVEMDVLGDRLGRVDEDKWKLLGQSSSHSVEVVKDAHKCVITSVYEFYNHL